MTPSHTDIPAGRLAEICVDSLDCWVLRSCYELRRAGATVSISDRPQLDAINVGDIYATGRRTRGLQAFFVIPRGDGHDPQLANFTLLQNQSMPRNATTKSVMIWLQPGIQPRDQSRGARIEHISFKGAARNLDEQFRSDDFRAALAAEGLTLQLDTDEGGQAGQAWANYRDTDLVLAVRNLTKYDAATKPASKLVNAWWAEVPALLGPEPAFAEIGRHGVDYVDIRKPQDVIDAVRLFRQNPASYDAMIDAGRTARAAYTDAAIAQEWGRLLNGPIAERFDRWQGRTPIWRAFRVMSMTVQERLAKRRHRAAFSQGARLLD